MVLTGIPSTVAKLRGQLTSTGVIVTPEYLSWYTSRELFDIGRQQEVRPSVTVLVPHTQTQSALAKYNNSLSSPGSGDSGSFTPLMVQNCRQQGQQDGPAPQTTHASASSLGSGTAMQWMNHSSRQPAQQTSQAISSQSASSLENHRPVALIGSRTHVPAYRLPRNDNGKILEYKDDAQGLKTRPDTSPATGIAPFQAISTFRPSRAVLNQERVLTPNRVMNAIQNDVPLNPNYLGDLSNEAIRNKNCPPHLNCAVRIENIAATSSNQEIFQLIREGKIYSFHKINPVPGRFPNCAARLVFTTRAAAKAFVERGQGNPGIYLHGQRFSVKWNRDRAYPAENVNQQSRVIRVFGPQDKVCAEGLEKLFHTQLKFELVDSQEWLVGGGNRLIELSFASIYGQSRVAFKFFRNFIQERRKADFDIWYAPDPCEQPPPVFGPSLAQGSG